MAPRLNGGLNGGRNPQHYFTAGTPHHFFVLIFSNTRGSGVGSNVSGVQGKIAVNTGRTAEQLRAADLVVTSLQALSPHNFLQVLQTAAKPHSAS
jgi:hypothetical protein